MRLNQRQDHRFIEGFHPAHIDDRGIQRLGRCQSLIQQHAKVEDGDAGSLAHQLGFTYFHSGELAVHRNARALAARVAHCRGALM